MLIQSLSCAEYISLTTQSGNYWINPCQTSTGRIAEILEGILKETVMALAILAFVWGEGVCLRKTTKNLRKNSRWLSKHSNQASPTYKSRALLIHQLILTAGTLHYSIKTSWKFEWHFTNKIQTHAYKTSCNAMHQDIGPLTKICPTALITIAILAILLLSKTCTTFL